MSGLLRISHLIRPSVQANDFLYKDDFLDKASSSFNLRALQTAT
jgi:hypothetical protein